MPNTLGLCRRSALPVALTLSLVAPPALRAQSAGPIDPRLYSALTWRNLGPFRGGRIAAVTGAIGQPGVFYIGTPAAGVWKTTSAGETWYPVFDAVKDVSSIGAVEVAPSDPNVVYVGTGDIITGGGDQRRQRRLQVDRRRRAPGDTSASTRRSRSRRCSSTRTIRTSCSLAAQGDVHAKSHDRGVYRSTDGGATWTQTLFVDDSTGVQKLARAFDTPTRSSRRHRATTRRPPPPAVDSPAAAAERGPQTGPTSTKHLQVDRRRRDVERRSPAADCPRGSRARCGSPSPTTRTHSACS